MMLGADQSINAFVNERMPINERMPQGLSSDLAGNNLMTGCSACRPTVAGATQVRVGAEGGEAGAAEEGNGAGTLKVAAGVEQRVEVLAVRRLTKGNKADRPDQQKLERLVRT